MAFHKAKALQEAEKSVAQGKIPQAIKLYQQIIDNDPGDVSLLNTVGDLYIRDRNVNEGLRQFHKLAEAYVRDGFNVKAIAIYRKISKIEPSSVDTMLKLAELYQLQGLSREAREQYLQATEFYKKRNQIERALETLRKLVQLDPENLNYRNRLAVEYEQSGKREEAGRIYLESAEIMLRREDQASAEAALKKAGELDPKNFRVHLLHAQVAMARHEPEEAERIVNADPDLKADAVGKRILLDAYLESRKLSEAEALVMEVFQGNPGEFAPVASVCELLLAKGDIDEAYKLLAGVAEACMNRGNAAPLVEALRRIAHKRPSHIPTLELLYKVCERTADELTLPEVLEALGRAYEQAGDLDQAEAAYVKLAEREPENETYRALLNAIQHKLGREIKPMDFASKEMALTEEEPAAAVPEEIDARQEAMVKEALENSDLFARYNLTEKAIAELEKVLQVYPNQVNVHRRILEIARKGFPERGAQAAAHLARIFAEMGDHDTAEKYQAIATSQGALHELPLPPPPPGKKLEIPAPLPEAIPAAPTSPPTAPLSGMTMTFRVPPLAAEEAAAPPAPAPPQEISFDLTPLETPAEPPAAPPPSVPEAMELDLSGDLESMAAFGFEAPAPPAPEPVAPPPAPEAAEPAAVPEWMAPPPGEEEATPEIPVSMDLPMAEPEPAPSPVAEAPPAPLEIPIDLSELPPPEPVVAEASEPPPVEIPVEAAEAPAPPVGEEISVELDDSRIEVEFYLENGFIDEARTTVAQLEEKYPGSALVAGLRHKLEARTSGAPAAQVPEILAPMEEPVALEAMAPAAEVEVAPVEPLPVPEPPMEEFLAAPLEEPVPLEPAGPEVHAELPITAVLEEPAAPVVDAEPPQPEVHAEPPAEPPVELAPPPPPPVEVAAPPAEVAAPDLEIAPPHVEVTPPPVPHVEVAPSVVETAPPPPAHVEAAPAQYEPLDVSPLDLPELEIEAAPTHAEVTPTQHFEAAPAHAEVAPHAPHVEAAPAHAEFAPPAEPEEIAEEEWHLPETYAAVPPSENALDPFIPASGVAPHAPPAQYPAHPAAPAPAAEVPAAPEAGGMDMLGDLAGDFASTLDELTVPEPSPPSPPAHARATFTPPPEPNQGAAQLSGLLAEMEEPGGSGAAKDDPETHYNLGVAFREMGLLDEAIGEFQKVVKGAGKGRYPQNFLQACSLLAICFMDKNMPAIATRWYIRALETPGLDEEALMALQYDLGLAYELAGDSRHALERFTEVYSQNIDFRDVAEKIRELQHKV